MILIFCCLILFILYSSYYLAIYGNKKYYTLFAFILIIFSYIFIKVNETIPTAMDLHKGNAYVRYYFDYDYNNDTLIKTDSIVEFKVK